MVQQISKDIKEQVFLDPTNLATGLLFRGAARGCAGDLTGSRADLACAQASRDLLRNRDQQSLPEDRNLVPLLDWALYTYGPAAGRCQ